ncbi:MAG TPA: hypothetical protein VF407_07755 [Polyangiaceae bacterium]
MLAKYTRFATTLPVLFAVACSSKQPPPPKPPAEVPADHNSSNTTATITDSDPAADAKEDRLIARMLKKVGEARGLTAKAPVPGKVLGRDALLAKVHAHIDTEVPKQAIVNEGLALQMFGFVPTKFDYEAETMKLLNAQLAGFYEPADKTMYMAGDLDDEAAKATLAHELVHSLQDQYWDLKTKSKYVPGQDDTSSARSALAEGDATSAMMDVILLGSGKTALDLPPDLFTQQIMGSMAGDDTANEPHAMVASLVAPYVYGTTFVNQLRREGGWDAVNKAWDDTHPLTSEQILHLDKWKAHEAAETVADPTVKALGAGWTAVDEDTGGEVGVLLTFEEWMNERDAKAAASHWAGDRQTIATNGTKAALAWHVRYDAAPGDANAFLKKATPDIFKAVQAKFGKPSKQGKDFLCFERTDTGPLFVTSKGRELVWIAGPTTTSPDGAWKSAGDCALAQKWAEEVAAQK